MNTKISMPTWIVDRFNNATENPPHYEPSLYGPTNALLTHIFPPSHRFMVKPQPRLRSSPDPATVAHGAGLGHKTTLSRDSYNNIVETNPKDPFPDFIVSTATGDLHTDRALIVLEIKTDHHGALGKAADQMRQYTAWVEEYLKQRPGQSIYAISMIGTQAAVEAITSSLVQDPNDPHGQLRVSIEYTYIGCNSILHRDILDVLNVVRETHAAPLLPTEFTDFNLSSFQ